MQSDAFEAWRRYTSIGALDKDLLRPEIYRAWERCHLAGSNPRRTHADCLSAVELARVIEANEELTTAVAPYVSALTHAVGDSRYAVLLTDANGVVYQCTADQETCDVPGTLPGVGSRLDETSAGSNGSGTALAEDHAARLFGPEHFVAGFHVFTCLGVALRDSSGRILGSLSVSLRSPQLAPRVDPLLEIIDKGVTAELVVRKLRRRVREMLAAKFDDALELERLCQDLIQCYTAAHLQVSLSARQLRSEGRATALQNANEAIVRFERMSRVWQLLADPAPFVPTHVDVQELLIAVVELMKTEASMTMTRLTSCTPDPCFVRATPNRLARFLLQRTRDAILRAGVGGAVNVTLSPTNLITWSVQPARADLAVDRVQLRGESCAS